MSSGQMGRSLTSMRSALRNLCTKNRPHLPTNNSFSLAAEQESAAGSSAGQILAGRDGSGKAEEKVSYWNRSRFLTPSKNEIWRYNGLYRSCSSSTMKFSHMAGSLLFRRGFFWDDKTETKPQESASKEEDEALLDSHDGGPTIGAEHTPSVWSEWTDKAYANLVDGVKGLKEADPIYQVISDNLSKILETYPIISGIATPVGVFTGAWIILPRVLRRLHGYVEQGSAAFSKGLSPVPINPVPYEQTMWQAMELPSRLFATILTMLQVGRLVAPNAMDAEYLSQFWAGGGVLCIVWFLHNWKSNVLKRFLSTQPLTIAERERYLTIDKFASLGLVFIGALGLAEAYGLAIHSLLTVGGIGGIATAFAAKDILGNILTGVTLSFSKPFSVGDQIKAGSVEGKVEEVGLHSTRLLNTEKNPIIVPNSYFQSQVIVNKSRAPWRSVAAKMPIQLKAYEKVPLLTEEIRAMLNRHPQVHFGEDNPRCSVAQFTPSFIEIAISCNVKPMSKDEFLLVQQGILLEAAAIITKSGAVLGGQA